MPEDGLVTGNDGAVYSAAGDDRRWRRRLTLLLRGGPFAVPSDRGDMQTPASGAYGASSGRRAPVSLSNFSAGNKSSQTHAGLASFVPDIEKY